MSDPIIYAYQKAEADRQKQLSLLKAALLARLAAAKVDHVEIPYDGEGDSGQIEDVHAYSAAGTPIALVGKPVEFRGRGKHRLQFASLREALEHFAWELLGIHHDGFENNDGGYGQITVRVSGGTPGRRRTAACSWRFSDDWRWTMPSNDSGPSRGLEIVVAFVVAVFLAFLFFGDQFGAVSDGSHLNASAKMPATASSPSIASPLTPPVMRPSPAAPSS